MLARMALLVFASTGIVGCGDNPQSFSALPLMSADHSSFGGQITGSDSSRHPSSTTRGGVLEDQIVDGQGNQLTFTNIRATETSRTILLSKNSQGLIVDLYNPLSGRRGRVQVHLDSQTGTFRGVTPAPGSQPYLCFDPSVAASMCSVESRGVNCSSPIFYFLNGRIAGSVGGHQLPAEENPCYLGRHPDSDRATWLRF